MSVAAARPIIELLDDLAGCLGVEFDDPVECCCAFGTYRAVVNDRDDFPPYCEYCFIKYDVTECTNPESGHTVTDWIQQRFYEPTLSGSEPLRGELSEPEPVETVEYHTRGPAPVGRSRPVVYWDEAHEWYGEDWVRAMLFWDIMNG